MYTSRICDLHCDTAQLWRAGSTLEDTSAQVSLPRLLEAGVGLQVFAAYVPPSLPEDSRYNFAVGMIDCIIEEIGKFRPRIVVCRSSREVTEAVRQGQIAALLAVENGDAIENDLEKLRELYRRGVRLMTLVHTRSNDWVISSADEQPAFDGLSRFGEEVVAAMNELGMIIDVSHVHDRAAGKVLERSSRPIVASHSCMRALCPIPRNINDELIRGIADGGGVIGLNFHPAFLDCGYRRIVEKRCKAVFARLDRRAEKAGADAAEMGRAWMRFTQEYRKAMGSEKVALERLLQHVDHLVDAGGQGAAAFGSDFDGIPDGPAGVEDCRGFSRILRGLRERGYSPSALEGICWSNFMRVLEAACG
ncbi:MAG: membrane dipeptidase [Spirochaetales bacterium]|nr:membrane dipeptidase [Spirochaetales bacterium]